jgi:hypothetical protein
LKIDDAYYDVLMPANVAVEAMQRAGLPVDVEKIRRLRADWARRVADLEREVEAESQRVGTPIKYSENHSVDPKKMAVFLYDGLGLTPGGDDGIGAETEGGGRSTSEEALVQYASLKVPRLEGDARVASGEFPPDDPTVRSVLLIRSLSGASTRYLDAFERTCRADGACHPKFNWALRTARLSAENPPVHQIPERANREVADAIKSCFVPRRSPCPEGESWDPRRHGSVFRWDISGAEAAIRAGVFAWRAQNGKDGPRLSTPLVAYDYIRVGKDIHSKTASLIYNVPEGTHKKGSYERDAVGKPTFFAKIFGASPNTVRMQIRNEARYFLDGDQAVEICDNFDVGYSDITQLYMIDMWRLWKYGYCTDAYGRTRAVPLPAGVEKKPWKWDVRNERGKVDLARNFFVPKGDKTAWYKLNEAFHTMANTPTQSTNAWDTMFMLALCHHGEYVELRVPPIWERGGVPFPEAKSWCMNEGQGPGGRPMLSWHSNTVHDSGWGDCAPGEYLEATAKLIWRRCRAVPLDVRLEADVPYRVELKVGPHFADLRDYNRVAKEFGLEPVEDR